MKNLLLFAFVLISFTATAQSTATINVDGQTFKIELSKSATINLIVDKTIKSRTNSTLTFKGQSFNVKYQSSTYTVTISGQVITSPKISVIRKAIKKELKK